MPRPKRPSKAEIERAIDNVLSLHDYRSVVEQDGVHDDSNVSEADIRQAVFDALFENHELVSDVPTDDGGLIIQPEEIGQPGSEYDKIRFFKEKTLEELYLRKEKPEKRIYRKKGSDELIDSDQSPRAEVNRITPKLQVRISQDHFDMFDGLSEHFASKRAALEFAIELLEDRMVPNLSNDPEP